jgi:hypothetical protein
MGSTHQAHPDNWESREVCRKIIHALVHRVEVLPDTFRMHYFVGQRVIEQKTGEILMQQEGVNSAKEQKKTRPVFLNESGSNILTFGWGTRIRT